LSHGSAEAEWIADSEDALADLEPGGIGEGNRLQVGCLNVEQSEIVHLVDIEDGGRVMGLVAEGALNSAVGALDDVIVGKDVAGFVADEAGALALCRHGAVE